MSPRGQHWCPLFVIVHVGPYVLRQASDPPPPPGWGWQLELCLFSRSSSNSPSILLQREPAEAVGLHSSATILPQKPFWTHNSRFASCISASILLHAPLAFPAGEQASPSTSTLPQKPFLTHNSRFKTSVPQMTPEAVFLHNSRDSTRTNSSFSLFPLHREPPVAVGLQSSLLRISLLQTPLALAAAPAPLQSSLVSVISTSSSALAKAANANKAMAMKDFIVIDVVSRIGKYLRIKKEKIPM